MVMSFRTRELLFVCPGIAGWHDDIGKAQADPSLRSG